LYIVALADGFWATAVPLTPAKPSVFVFIGAGIIFSNYLLLFKFSILGGSIVDYEIWGNYLRMLFLLLLPYYLKF
jgi:hypothetical protein